MTQNNGQPLSGVKVVDLTYYVAGPGTAKILADWGADVLKIEPPGGEPGRTTGLTLNIPSEDKFNPYFGTFNSNKRAIGLNLKTEEGKVIMDKLLSEANIFVTSFRPGALKRLGLDYNTMHKKYPHIIWASINGFGELGPDKNKAGFDTVAFWAKSGAMLDLPEKDTSPINPTLAFGDAATACSLAGGICAALYKQVMTGEGSKIMLSLYSQAIWQLGPVIASSQFGDVYPKTRKDPNGPLVNSYKTKDNRWIFICIFDDRLYKPFYEKVLNKPEWAQNDNYNNPVGVKSCSAELTALLEKEFAKYTLDEMVKLLTDADIAYEIIGHVADVLHDAQAWANHYIADTVQPSGDSVIMAQSPVKIDTLDTPARYSTPCIGEHTIEILKELGYSDEEILTLEKENVVGIMEEKKADLEIDAEKTQEITSDSIEMEKEEESVSKTA